MLAILRERFLRLPVAVNNYIGDPCIQWENTLRKLERLAQDGHKGTVALLTRGYISLERAKQLRGLGLKKLVVIVPVSHLKGVEIENHSQRYRSIENLLKEGVRVLPNVRPLIMGHNDREVPRIFRKLKELGVNLVVVSGIRGNDEVLLNTLTPEEARKYNLRVKIIPKELGKLINQAAVETGIEVAKRVSCGVARLWGKPSHNPYWNSPQLAGCFECPLRDICYEEGIKRKEAPDDLEKFLEIVGFEWERLTTSTVCTVKPENRLECPSCCTACYMHGNNTIVIKNKPISLGTLAFLRFLFPGWTFTHYGIQDTGAKDTAVVYLPKVRTVRPPECVNTWYVVARQLSRCYGCKYCIVNAYKPEEREHGLFPMELYREVEKIWD
jgi:hypothetical protein